MSEQIYTLVHSTNRGRFALDDGQYGPDLTCGVVVSIQVGKSWVTGHVEHTPKVGYYLDVDEGVSFPLRAGMKVQLPE